MSGRIAAAPSQLTGVSRKLKDAAVEVQSVSTSLRAPLPPMPGDVRGHVEGELGWALVALSQLVGALIDEAGNASRRGNLFELAGEGGFTAALGGYLGALERYTDPWIDGLEKVLIAPRYVRFGTWVRAYTYVNKYGTVVNVDRHWRNLPNKLMEEKPVFAGIGEDSKLVKGVKIAGRAGAVLTFVTSGLEEWEADQKDSTDTRVAKTVVVAGATTGGALAGAEIGAGIGASAGSVVPLVGTAAGGVVGGLVGGFAGSEGGKAVGHLITHFF